MISNLSIQDCNILYKQVLRDNDFETMKWLCLNDLFFLLTIVCKRQDMNRQWIFDRIREVEKYPNNHLDLWFRAGYKSSIITFGKTMQDILINPEVTVGIFSHTRPIAKTFANQIKRELEGNEFLKDLFPDVLYKSPSKESPKWSLDDGIIVKRKGNPKEATLEAWGLIDGQPTSRHYSLMVYDDVVSRESVTTPEMIHKTTEAFSLSLNLAAEVCNKRFIGTRYHANDTYSILLQRGTATPRIYPATEDGKIGGKSVLLSQSDLDQKHKDQGSYVFSCQMLQNPLADNAMGFNTEWIETYSILNHKESLNYYIIVDPAGEKKKTNDYTVMLVIGLGSDNNYYLVDGIRDRLNLTERTNKLFELQKKWNPKNIGYEKYGLQSDIEHIRYVQEQNQYRFRITEIGGGMPKNDRIRRLVPLFENHRFYLPNKLCFKSYDGKIHDLIQEFITEEYETFPISTHDDMFDCMARIVDVQLEPMFPDVKIQASQKTYNPLELNREQVKQYNPLYF